MNKMSRDVLRHLRAAAHCGSLPAISLLHKRNYETSKWEWNTTYCSQPRIFQYTNTKLQVLGKDGPWAPTLRLAEASVIADLTCQKLKGYYALRWVLDPANWADMPGTSPPAYLDAAKIDEWAKALASVKAEAPVVMSAEGRIWSAAFILNGGCYNEDMTQNISNVRVACCLMGQERILYDFIEMHAEEWGIDAIAPQQRTDVWLNVSETRFAMLSKRIEELTGPFPGNPQKVNFCADGSTVCPKAPPPFLRMRGYVDFQHEKVLWVHNMSYLPCAYNQHRCHECGKTGTFSYGLCDECVEKNHTTDTQFGRFTTEPPIEVNGKKFPGYCGDNKGGIAIWYKLYQATGGCR